MAQNTAQIAIAQLALLVNNTQLAVVRRNYFMSEEGKSEVQDETWYIERLPADHWRVKDETAQGYDDGIIDGVHTINFPNGNALADWLQARQPFIYIERIRENSDQTEIYRAPKTQF